MFADAREVAPSSAIATDVCIIGAGAAGITIARALAGRSVSVTVLESGGDTFDAATQDLYEGPQSGVPYFPLDAPRLRYFGGTTNHWAGVCRPFDEVDFEERDWIPDSGWPISKADVDPYYVRAQEVVQLPSDGWTTDTWIERDPSPPIPFEAGPIVTRVDQIVPPDLRSFATLYGDELRSAANVTVMLWANVTEIVTDPSGATVTHVDVTTLSGTRFTVVADTFVLAASGIENPRLLLASRSAAPNGVGNDHDVVGRYFLEHPRFIAGIATPSAAGMSFDFYDQHEVDGALIHPRLALTRETQEAERLVDVQVRVEAVRVDALERTEGSAEVNALKSIRDALRDGDTGEVADDLRAVLSDLMTWRSYVLPGAPLPVPYPEVVGRLLSATPIERQSLIPSLLGQIAGFVYAEVGNPAVETIQLTARFDPVPNRESRVTLADEVDELGVPRASLDWRLSELDRHSVRRTMEILAAEFGRADVGRVRILFDEAGTAWPADLAGGFHLMGTTRMHDDPTRGVVDGDCRVHGIENLYVAGSSVFTTGGAGNPTMLIVALALRLADRIAGPTS